MKSRSQYPAERRSRAREVAQAPRGEPAERGVEVVDLAVEPARDPVEPRCDPGAGASGRARP